MNDSVVTLHTFATLLLAGLSPEQAQDRLGAALEKLPKDLRAKLSTIVTAGQTYGSPIAQLVGVLANQAALQTQFEQKLKVSNMVPKLTARLVTWLPLLVLVGAQLVGLGPIDAASHNLVAATSLVSGAGLVYLNHRLTRKILVRSRANFRQELSNLLDLTDLQLSLKAGLPVATLNLDGFSAEFSKLLKTALENGSSLEPLLKASSKMAMSEFEHKIEQTAQLLQIRLLTPIALLALPIISTLVLIPSLISFVTK